MISLSYKFYTMQPAREKHFCDKKFFFILVEVVINMEVGLRKVGIYAKNSDDFHIGFFVWHSSKFTHIKPIIFN